VVVAVDWRNSLGNFVGVNALSLGSVA
jgi:hypothetical protein